jgi:PAS domain S-box-containing protein
MTLRVLIVDNDFFFVEFLSDLLTGRGYEVVKAYDGKEAIGHLESDSFDLVFLDIVMPKIEGDKVIEYVHARFSPAGFPIVALSGSIIERLDVLGRIGADYYIAKGPIEKMEAEIVRFLMEFERSGFDSKGKVGIDSFFEPEHLYPRQETAELMEVIDFQKGIIESLATGVLVLDRDSRFIHANTSALHILGLGMEDLLNRPFVSIFVNEDRPLVVSTLKRVVARDSRGFHRISARIRNGPVSVTPALLKSGGKSVGWVVALEEDADG